MRQKTSSQKGIVQRVLIQLGLFAGLFLLATSLKAFAAADMDQAIDQLMEESKQELVRGKLTLNIEHNGLQWKLNHRNGKNSYKVVGLHSDVKELIDQLDPQREYKCRAMAVLTRSREARLIQIESCLSVIRTDSLRR